MGLIIRWKRMKYGTGKRDPERYMGFLLFCVCSAKKTEERELKFKKFNSLRYIQ